jgi:hypothetical protein
MKLVIAFFVCLAALAAAEPKSITRTSMPAGAVRADDGSYRYTDTDGRMWVYRKTPFGIARAEDISASSAKVTATRDGDVIRFERPTPFGTHQWQRNVSELNETEQAIWNREKARAAKKD